MKLSKIKKIINIICQASLYAFLVASITAAIVYKFNNRTFYFFGNRFDVVLSGSMSTKNEAHLDFLEGHDDQIQAFDFVLSKQVNEDTELKVYDIVLFDNPKVGTDMHRIVDIKYEGDIFYFDKLSKSTFNEIDTFTFEELSSKITSKTSVQFSGFEIITYTEDEFDKDELYFNINYTPVDFEVESTLIDDSYYRNVITFDRGSNSPAIFSITRKGYQVFSHFESITLLNDEKTMVIEPSILDESEEQEYLYNPVPLYLIRGDAAETDDGWFYKKDIYSLVYHNIPKFGYFARFISSPFGVILIIVLGITPIIYSYFSNRRKEKNEEKL